MLLKKCIVSVVSLILQPAASIVAFAGFQLLGKLEKSIVADNDSGESVASEVRTSSGMFLSKRQDDIVATVEAKLAAWTFLPEENGQSMQILHYENGQKYEPHFDFFHDQVNQQLGGHRIATVLMYLSNVKKGGETVFPMWKIYKAQRNVVLCAAGILLYWCIHHICKYNKDLEHLEELEKRYKAE
ncbi:probable prolyl 4-hydroxylase 7 isoform X1 [Brassica napus]|uniref:probable prolyl 4-hydroxylase 7 isoform X1 n=1 Tax=Brassica napus TaxID=3708 RepID=UPI002078D696|nr:probable prolyl 4-hydroxylase 7 isoform X1 [Brassica napus]XP_048629657.1 probable prolyl 4-hydroxylase 7 isoform X1 [Brassica napus]